MVWKGFDWIVSIYKGIEIIIGFDGFISIYFCTSIVILVTF